MAAPKKVSAVSANANAALLEAVLADPADDLPRTVYADWMQQREDPRGELITLQLAASRLPKGAKRRALENKAESLIAMHKKTWAPPFGKYTYERGFAVLWKVPVDTFPRYATAVFAAEPIQTLDVSQGNALDPSPSIEPMLARPELARVKRLEIRRVRIPVEMFAKFVATKSLANLRELDLTYAAMSKSSIESLTQLAAFTKLEKLCLSGTRVDDRFGVAFAASPFATSLRELDLSATAVGAPGMLAIAATKGLTKLVVTKCKLGKAAKMSCENALARDS
jgi:uncharacterized protein (TIGR02996 family)